MDADPQFAEFVANRGDALLRYGYVLAGNPHDAADLVQEALLKLRGAWPRVRLKDNPEGYARTTMARLHIAAWHRRRRERPAWDLPEGEHHDRLPSGQEEQLWQALAGLPRKQRAVLVLRYYEQLTDAEIAKVLGVSTGTVRSQASRALAKLRSAIPPDESAIPHDKTAVPHDETAAPHDETAAPHDKTAVPHDKTAAPHNQTAPGRVR